MKKRLKRLGDFLDKVSASPSKAFMVSFTSLVLLFFHFRTRFFPDDMREANGAIWIFLYIMATIWSLRTIKAVNAARREKNQAAYVAINIAILIGALLILFVCVFILLMIVSFRKYGWVD